MPLKYNSLNHLQKLIFDNVFIENYQGLCEIIFLHYGQTDSAKETLINQAVDKHINSFKTIILSLLTVLKQRVSFEALVHFLRENPSLETLSIEILDLREPAVIRRLIASIEAEEFWHDLESTFRRTISFSYSAADLSKILLKFIKVDYLSYQRRYLLQKPPVPNYRYSQELVIKVQAAQRFAINSAPLYQVIENIRDKENAFALPYDIACTRLVLKRQLLNFSIKALKYLGYITIIGLVAYQQTRKRPFFSMQYWMEILVCLVVSQVLVKVLYMVVDSFLKDAMHTKDRLDQVLKAVQEQLILSLQPKPAKFIAKHNGRETQAFIFIDAEEPTPYSSHPIALAYCNATGSVPTKKLPKTLRSKSEATGFGAMASPASAVQIKFTNGMIFNPAGVTEPHISPVRNTSHLYAYFDREKIEASRALTLKQLNRFERLVHGGALIASRSKGETGIKSVKGSKYIHDADGNIVAVSHKAKICGDGARIYAHVIHSEGNRERLACFTSAESAKEAHR